MSVGGRRAFGVTLGLALVVILSSGCRKKKGVVVASCERRSTSALQSVCLDAFDKKQYWITDCTRSQGDTWAEGRESDKPCDRKGALAGCKDPMDGIKWYFPGKSVRTVGHVASICTGNDTLLAADGSDLKGIAPVPPLNVAEVELEQFLPAYQPKIDPKLAAIEQLAKKLPSPSSRVMVTDEEIKEAFIAHVDDLKTLGDEPSVGQRSSSEGLLATCARLVRKKDIKGMKGSSGEVAKDALEVGSALSKCSTSTHLMVIRVASLKRPKPVGGINEFEAGSASGDVMIFELTKGKLVGAAPYTATSSRGLSTTWKNFESDLQSDFGQQLVNAWGSAATKAAPKRKFSL